MRWRVASPPLLESALAERRAGLIRQVRLVLGEENAIADIDDEILRRTGGRDTAGAGAAEPLGHLILRGAGGEEQAKKGGDGHAQGHRVHDHAGAARL